MKSIFFSFIACILWLSTISYAQTCDAFTEEVACTTSSSCTWIASSDLCRCASEVKMDIMFAIDASTSIGYDGFVTQRDFIRKLVTQGINNDDSNIGFYMFSTYVNESRGLQRWDADELLNYVNGIYYETGCTNTAGVIESSLTEFENTYDPERQQVLMLITDGSPFGPCTGPSGNEVYSVCNYASTVLAAGIRVIIIAVGDGLTTEYVECLCQDDDDFIPVASFSPDDFNSIMGSLSGVVCPVYKDAKVTEVKAEKKQSGWNKRWSRYIEIYNSGVEFNVNDIELDGLVTMSHGTGPDVTVSQGQYLVFYDAADDAANVGGNSTVSCHLCGATCDLDTCSVAGDSTSDDYCWCENAIYVACSNTAESCPSNLPNGVSHSAYNGCSACSFDDSMDRSNWDITVSDSAAMIDDVVYDSSTWITVWDGYAYELRSKGFDNDVGDNWAQTCSVFGTPGTDPSEDCDEVCNIVDDCGDGGSCNTDTQICDCDNGYYPQCTSAVSCVTCLQVPEVEDCNVTWMNNGTDRYADFKWSAVDRQSETQYRLTYYAGSKNGDTSDVSVYEVIYQTEDYYSVNTSFGGYVETEIEVCTNTSNTGTEICATYYSGKTACEVYTQSPTAAPSPAPTTDPTPSPSNEPTQSPVWPCPTYWWTNEGVCKPDQCNCDGVSSDGCCLDDPDWDVTYDSNRSHDDSYECKLDSDLLYPSKREEGADEAQYTNGYLLSSGQHNFLVDIDSDDYPWTMDIEWELQFDLITCSYDGNGTDTEDCDTNDPAVAGLQVEPLKGNMTVWGAADIQNTTVSFTVTQLTCDEADVIVSNSSNDTVRRRRSRRLLSDDTSCFDDTAVYGSLVITKAASREQPDCYDGRVYPMRIPVWFNYAEAFVTPPSDTSEIPGWLWWLIAGLAVFLGVLAVFVYWYWFKNKKTGAALSAKQIEIDAEVEINENGWQSGLNPNAVGFNPLATGFNPNAAAGAADPNAPLNGGGGGQDFVRPNVEKTVFREQYGPNAGNLR